MEQGRALSFRSRDRTLGAGAVCRCKSGHVVVTLCRHLSLQWKFVRDGADKFALARRNHAARWTLLPRRLGLAHHFASKVVAAAVLAASNVTLHPASAREDTRLYTPRPANPGFQFLRLALYNRSNRLMI